VSKTPRHVVKRTHTRTKLSANNSVSAGVGGDGGEVQTRPEFKRLSNHINLVRHSSLV
jgi:hypothetical protein